MPEREHDEREPQGGAIIPEMVDEVRAGKLPRRRLIATLTTPGIPHAAGAGALLAAAEHKQPAQAAPHVDHQDDAQHHLQLHQQHITHQEQGTVGALREEYAEHAVVEDALCARQVMGRTAIMARKGLAAIPDLRITIANRLAHGNQVSAEWVASDELALRPWHEECGSGEPS